MGKKRFILCKNVGALKKVKGFNFIIIQILWFDQAHGGDHQFQHDWNDVYVA